MVVRFQLEIVLFLNYAPPGIISIPDLTSPKDCTDPVNIDDQLAYLTKGAAETISVEELRARLERSARTGKPLRIKVGFDPTAPDIHLGHHRS